MKNRKNMCLAILLSAVLMLTLMPFMVSADTKPEIQVSGPMQQVERVQPLQQTIPQVPLTTAFTAKALAGGVGGSHTSLALKDDGTVWAWGWNAFGQLGIGTAVDYRPTPVQVKGPLGKGNLTGITALVAGHYHSLALKDDGTVWAWGWNHCGEIGDGTSESCNFKMPLDPPPTIIRPTPVQVKGPLGKGNLTGITAIAGGGWRSLALKYDGTVWTWGWNGWSTLGDGTNDSKPHPTPVQVKNLTGIKAIAGGYNYVLVLKYDGTVWAWGQNDGSGELGDGTTTNRNTPVQVKGKDGVGYLTGITALAAGSNHSLAIKSDGSVWAWGYNPWGQLGDGTSGSSNNRSTPVEVKTTLIIHPLSDRTP
ncbi:MAG: hypothetical protein LBQ00_00490 [Syntrophobacterales bacterium]|nr:hypothetical protein [Syntrophobacterales bacterium]